MQPLSASTIFKHDAFISYSRQNEPFGSKLEQALESYKPPKQLNVPQRYLDVFRDKTDFITGEYSVAVENNLRRSAKLIVICSPEARSSHYVNDEIRRFANIRGARHIIPVLFSGVPNLEARPGQEDQMAFPEALCEVMEMPLAANYLGYDTRKDKVNAGAYLEGWFTILADIYELSRSEVEQRERKRLARNRRVSVSALSGSLLVLSVLLALDSGFKD